MKNKNKNLTDLFINILLLVLSVCLFVLQQPNDLFNSGLPFIAFFSYLPVLFCVKRVSVKYTWIYGGFYGAFGYALLGHWIIKYGTWAIVIVTAGYFIVSALFFTGLKIIELLFKKNAWLVQFLFICSYEYVKTLGFLGVNYGITAYSQWNNLLLIQICDKIGALGLNLIVIFPSCLIYSYVKKTAARRTIKNNILNDSSLYECRTHLNYESKDEKKLKLNSLRLNFIFSALWIIVVAGSLIYGGKKLDKKYNDKTITVAAIQHNENPFDNSVESYVQNTKNLIELTDEAFFENPDIKLVVWPETSVVPSIMYQYYVKKEPVRLNMINELLSFMDNRNAVFVIGNGYTQKKGSVVKSYNSSLVFDSGKNVMPPAPEYYFKNHLVPFSEALPNQKYFPNLYKFFVSKENNLWTPGTEVKVFTKDDFCFSTPICFEDTFSDICRKMYLKGARCFINMSNDSWSGNKACQNQHLSISVFRCVENRVPEVRSCTSGVTCIINPDGKILCKARCFTKDFIYGDIPVISQDQKPGFFTRFGNVLCTACCFLTVFLLIMQIIIVIIRKNHKHKN